MRFSKTQAILLLSATSIGSVVADDIDDAVGDNPAEASTGTSPSPSMEVSKPNFTPLSNINSGFFEQFTADWDTRWRPSHAKKENTEEEWSYVGNWAVEEPTELKGIIGDKGLVVKDKAAHHAISAKFEKPIDNKGKTLVVQYEVKLQDGLECGGAYLKLLKENKELHQEEFSNASPYVIMFGPDKCGATNKVHFIFKHKNPKTGEYEEKHFNSPAMARITKKTVLYTLIIRPDNTFEIRMDGEKVKNGSLLEDFTPSVNPPKEIDDKDDKKPEDWVEDAMIPDPAASKPEDWDEDAPFQIVDEEATKPEDWLEDEPEQIPDPEATKPEGWVDDEDGDWIAPMIPNPKCDDVSGCGKWEKPLKNNPDYKGKWTAPMIENPDYKGEWAPRKIANPDYFEDEHPSDLEPMGAIGFELWTMSKDILFDNIYVGHSVEDAEEIQRKTFDVKHKVETEEDEQNKPPLPEEPKSAADIKFTEDPVNYFKTNLDLFITLAKEDPIKAVQFMPQFVGGLAAGIITILGILIGTIFAVAGGSGAAAAKTTADAAKKAANKAKAGAEKVAAEAEAKTTGSDKPEAKKRATSKKE